MAEQQSPTAPSSMASALVTFAVAVILVGLTGAFIVERFGPPTTWSLPFIGIQKETLYDDRLVVAMDDSTVEIRQANIYQAIWMTKPGGSYCVCSQTRYKSPTGGWKTGCDVWFSAGGGGGIILAVDEPRAKLRITKLSDETVAGMDEKIRTCKNGTF
jgi:hypothetical protein